MFKKKGGGEAERHTHKLHSVSQSHSAVSVMMFLPVCQSGPSTARPGSDSCLRHEMGLDALSRSLSQELLLLKSAEWGPHTSSLCPPKQKPGTDNTLLRRVRVLRTQLEFARSPAVVKGQDFPENQQLPQAVGACVLKRKAGVKK